MQNFVDNLINERQPPISIDDGIATLYADIATTHACQSWQPLEVSTIGV